MTKEQIFEIIKNHEDTFGFVFTSDSFNDSDILNISDNVMIIIKEGLNIEEKLKFLFYDIEDTYDMNVSTDTLDDLVDKLLFYFNY